MTATTTPAFAGWRRIHPRDKWVIVATGETRANIPPLLTLNGGRGFE